MRIHHLLLLPLAIGCASSPREVDSPSLAAGAIADQGSFVVTLGRDTIAAERFRFGRGRIDGEVVVDAEADLVVVERLRAFDVSDVEAVEQACEEIVGSSAPRSCSRLVNTAVTSRVFR